ncbi:hypothetical protein K469DRAFT_709826 [Zopfia rhizophila CBS 207.26]|uniref:Mediator of RNA polymerase II transcription subunit 21 n=1 Tax=Zopfia rhizophila CBS 207.26 TaxID=1314779 RepID=A0A6A6ETI7_9PEZI|nr:hypothetical protein K469DRAFT_709826 [Zopfia rhizophila CBS 207.26]
MADTLTQIQDELDQLLLQMQKTLEYINIHAPPAPIPGQPTLSSLREWQQQYEAQSQATSQTPGANQSSAPTQNTQTTQPSSAPTQTQSTTLEPPPKSFQDNLKELSRDMVLKEQQIEMLICTLPGIGTSEREQVERMKELERELDEIEEERVEAVAERRRLLEAVEGAIMGMGTI